MSLVKAHTVFWLPDAFTSLSFLSPDSKSFSAEFSFFFISTESKGSTLGECSCFVFVLGAGIGNSLINECLVSWLYKCFSFYILYTMKTLLLHKIDTWLWASCKLSSVPFWKNEYVNRAVKLHNSIQTMFSSIIAVRMDLQNRWKLWL